MFAFKQDIREKIRKELGLSEERKVFGHVGRFNIQKNHAFLINVFKEIQKKEKNAVLLLIGEGELEDQIKKQVESLKLDKNILFLGPKENVNEYLMAMDALLFPSFFEGMPNVVIEAQATGLKSFISNTITRDADLTGLVSYLDIQKDESEWAHFILKNLDYKRKDYKKEFMKNGYLIDSVVSQFTELVFKENE